MRCAVQLAVTDVPSDSVANDWYEPDAGQVAADMQMVDPFPAPYALVCFFAYSLQAIEDDVLSPF